MNKRAVMNAGVYLLLFVFVFSACDGRSTEQKYQDEIRYFVLEHLDDGLDYTPLGFQKIDNGFLMSDLELATSMLAVQDSVKAKLNFALQYSIEYHSDLLNRFTAMQGDFVVDLIDEVIVENVKLDKAIHTNLKKKNQKLPDEFRAQQQKFNDGISVANSRLTIFNLSAYHLDLSENTTVYYIHRFQINDEAPQSTVFELDVNTFEILSFKEV